MAPQIQGPVDGAGGIELRDKTGPAGRGPFIAGSGHIVVAKPFTIVFPEDIACHPDVAQVIDGYIIPFITFGSSNGPGPHQAAGGAQLGYERVSACPALTDSRQQFLVVGLARDKDVTVSVHCNRFPPVHMGPSVGQPVGPLYVAFCIQLRDEGSCCRLAAAGQRDLPPIGLSRDVDISGVPVYGNAKALAVLIRRHVRGPLNRTGGVNLRHEGFPRGITRRVFWLWHIG